MLVSGVTRTPDKWVFLSFRVKMDSIFLVCPSNVEVKHPTCKHVQFLNEFAALNSFCRQNGYLISMFRCSSNQCVGMIVFSTLLGKPERSSPPSTWKTKIPIYPVPCTKAHAAVERVILAKLVAIDKQSDPNKESEPARDEKENRSHAFEWRTLTIVQNWLKRRITEALYIAAYCPEWNWQVQSICTCPVHQEHL